MHAGGPHLGCHWAGTFEEGGICRGEGGIDRVYMHKFERIGRRGLTLRRNIMLAV